MADEKHYLERELEELLRTDPSMWDFLRRGSLDGVWYWNLEKPDEEWMSPEFWRLFGIDPLTRRHDPAEWKDLIFPEDLGVAVENFEKHCADPDHPYDQIVRYRHADGSTVWVRCRGIAIRDTNGKPVRLLGAHNDLTTVKHAEEQARQEREAAEEAHRSLAIVRHAEERARADKAAADAANSELRSFAYSISHELKAPSNTLQVILSELARRNQLHADGLTGELLELGRETVERMQNLIEDVLGYTRVIEQTPTFEAVSLTEILQSVINDLYGAIVESQAKVHVEDLPDIHGNRTQLELLFRNLIENAIKFRRLGVTPEISVTCEARDVDGCVRISVADNGIGVPAECRHRIFELFQRLHLKDEFPGAGLGLTLCRRIALGHGGRIGVASNEGGGTIFTVELRSDQK